MESVKFKARTQRPAGLLPQLEDFDFADLVRTGRARHHNLPHAFTSEKGISILDGLGTLLASRDWIFFLAMAFIAGMGLASTNNYLFAYMKERKASETNMGIARTISILSELPVLSFANRLISNFRPFGLFLLGMTITGIRLLFYFVVSTPAGVLGIQTFQGLTFPVVLVAGVSYAEAHVPAGMRANAQGLFGALISGFGRRPVVSSGA